MSQKMKEPQEDVPAGQKGQARSEALERISNIAGLSREEQLLSLFGQNSPILKKVAFSAWGKEYRYPHNEEVEITCSDDIKQQLILPALERLKNTKLPPDVLQLFNGRTLNGKEVRTWYDLMSDKIMTIDETKRASAISEFFIPENDVTRRDSRFEIDDNIVLPRLHYHFDNPAAFQKAKENVDKVPNEISLVFSVLEDRLGGDRSNLIEFSPDSSDMRIGLPRGILGNKLIALTAEVNEKNSTIKVPVIVKAMEDDSMTINAKHAKTSGTRAFLASSSTSIEFDPLKFHGEVIFDEKYMRRLMNKQNGVQDFAEMLIDLTLTFGTDEDIRINYSSIWMDGNPAGPSIIGGASEHKVVPLAHKAGFLNPQ